MSTALDLMRVASDAVLTEIVVYALDRRAHATTNAEGEAYNWALRLAVQVRDERRALAREIADAAIDGVEVTVADGNEPPLTDDQALATFRAMTDEELTGALIVLLDMRNHQYAEDRMNHLLVLVATVRDERRDLAAAVADALVLAEITNGDDDA